MRRGRLYSFIIAIFAAGLWATVAYAVATNVKVVGVGGNPVAKAKVKVTLNDGSITQGITDAGGQVALNVDLQNVKETEVETNDGERRRRAGAWFLTGDAVVLDLTTMMLVSAATGAGLPSMGSSFASSVFGTTEVIISGGFVRGFGGTGGSVQNFGSTTMQGQDLKGGSFNVTLRTLPFEFFGVRVGASFEYDEFFSADGTGGIGSKHPTPGNDTFFTRRVDRAFGFGITQVVPIGEGWALDFMQGFAVVQQRFEFQTDESGGGGMLEKFGKCVTNIVPKFGASVEYQIPGTPFRVRLASEFMYLPSLSLNGTSSTFGFNYVANVRGQMMATSTIGFVVPVSFLAQPLMSFLAQPLM